MSQIDPDEYQNEGSSALKDAANETGKIVTNKIAKKVGQAAVTKAGLPVILGIVAVILILGMITISIFVIVASGGEEAKPEGSGYWSGDISELGVNEIPAQFIPIYKAAEQKYGVPWNLLAAHHRVETRFSSINPMLSPVGAEGHMQVRP